MSGLVNLSIAVAVFSAGALGAALTDDAQLAYIVGWAAGVVVAETINLRERKGAGR